MSDRQEITLTRYLKASGPLGTFGEIDTGKFKYPTLERPATGDHPCIPAGSYDVDWTDDGRHPQHNPCYEVMNVPGRTAILIHAANWYQELLGCIAPGTKNEVVEGNLPDGTPIKQLGVSGSGPALKAFLNDMGRLNFRLNIVEG
jgi:hypothetical protein